ncbi:MAG: GNAT family N-acetyltransferase [Gammaproteobacteria bacterium]|nr:GNAT family N-acetyltransferase [Gammaproteobacteria bacterium]
MTERMYFAPLGSRDAGSIQRLQKRSFPPALREDLQEITETLVNTEKHKVCNLSFGLFDSGKMVGYMFAYVESTSLYHEREEEVVYLKEIVLLPGYESMLLRLFTKLFQQLSAFTPGTPLEAHVLDESLRSWKRMARVFKYYGLTLSSRVARHEDGKLPYHLLRLDFDAATSDLAQKALPLPKVAWTSVGDVSISVVTEPRQWLTLQSDWEALLSDTVDSNVFQSFDYLWLWWKYLGIWHDLRVIVITRGDSVIGVIPMMIEHFDIYGKTVRKLMFISAPMEMSRPKLIFGGNDADCIPAFFQYLERSENEWDIIDIDEQIAGGQTDGIRAELEARNYLVAESETLCPYIEIDTDWKSFMAGRPRKKRSNINRLRRRSAELGNLDVRLVDQWPQLQKAMDDYCDIESRSWKASKSLDIASDKEDLFFYCGLAETFGRRRNFELRILECAGKSIAGTFGIRKNGVFQSLKIAHDVDYGKYSPGTLLESYELEHLFATDLKLYEFMGSFLANKLRWTSTVHKTTNLHIYQRQPRLMLFFFVYFVFKRHVKKVLKKIGQFENVDRLLKRFPNNPFLRP